MTERKLPNFIEHKPPQQINPVSISARMIFDSAEKLDQTKVPVAKKPAEAY